MQDFFFYLFAAMTLLSRLLVVANPFSRNPVTSAMFLVLTIVWMAGLFVLLHAFFLAAVQILVYAGAVIVLFLFVIMLLDLKEEEQRRLRVPAVVLGALTAGLVGFFLIRRVAAGGGVDGGAGAFVVCGSPAAL
jgi:NADH-quinone oxidoreductase subunit J